MRGILLSQEDEYNKQTEVLIKALMVIILVNLTIAILLPIAVALLTILLSIYPTMSLFTQLRDLFWVK